MAPPPTVEFMVRTPRLTKPFELKKKRVQKRIMTRRKVASAAPKVVRQNVGNFSYGVEAGCLKGLHLP